MLLAQFRDFLRHVLDFFGHHGITPSVQLDGSCFFGHNGITPSVQLDGSCFLVTTNAVGSDRWFVFLSCISAVSRQFRVFIVVVSVDSRA